MVGRGRQGWAGVRAHSARALIEVGARRKERERGVNASEQVGHKRSHLPASKGGECLSAIADDRVDTLAMHPVYFVIDRLQISVLQFSVLADLRSLLFSGRLGSRAQSNRSPSGSVPVRPPSCPSSPHRPGAATTAARPPAVNPPQCAWHGSPRAIYPARAVAAGSSRQRRGDGGSHVVSLGHGMAWHVVRHPVSPCPLPRTIPGGRRSPAPSSCSLLPTRLTRPPPRVRASVRVQA